MRRVLRCILIIIMSFLLLFILCIILYLGYGKLKSILTKAEPLPQVNAQTISRYPSAADYSQLIGKLDAMPRESGLGYDIRSADLSDSNLTDSYDELILASFDSKTKWPAQIPPEFNPDKIMDIQKNPGLHIRELHKMGITGKGIGIAMIDQPLLVNHIEYKEQIKYYQERNTVSSQEASMHGPAVASIAVGKTSGVAPDANLYYIADDFIKIQNDFSLLAESINLLLDMNKSLPYDNRIRVISISWGLDYNKKADQTKGYNELFKAYERAKKEDVLVLTTSISKRENLEFFGLDKIPLSDPDDINTYTENLYGVEDGKLCISVPMNCRCVASPTGISDYVAYRNGGLSWATPYIAGLYALACQTKPDINYEEFWEIASATSKTSSGIYNGESYQADYIVDPMTLIQSLKESEK